METRIKEQSLIFFSYFHACMVWGGSFAFILFTVSGRRRSGIVKGYGNQNTHSAVGIEKHSFSNTMTRYNQRMSFITT